MIKKERNIWYYEITFKDGRNIRREYVSKKIAESMFKAMEYEMILFNVDSVSWGLMDAEFTAKISSKRLCDDL